MRPPRLGRGMATRQTIRLDGSSLRVDDVVASARDGARAELDEACRPRLEASRRVVEDLLESDRPVYGITTGYGELARVRIDPDDNEALQRNLVRSHAAGVGEPLPADVVRAAMLIRANTLAKGYSGVRERVITTLLDMLNAGVHPVVPAKGSLGASGDLAPLAHLALPMIGEGRAVYDGRPMAGAEAMKAAGIDTLTLQAKEGLALLNGTAFMAALGSLSLDDGWSLLLDAQVAGAMSLEALLGTDQAFRPEVGDLRPHPGQVCVAQNVWALTRESEIMASHRTSDHRVQDAYTLRCMPQVLGAALDTLAYAEEVVTTELNSVTDNPLILPDGDVVSAGNFHGQPLAQAMDYLAIALSEVASMAERRIDRMLDSHRSELPPFLVKEEGLNSGFMVAQYTAAALVSENKVLSHPASVDSIPTSANQEDHVSMGMMSGLKLRSVVENSTLVVAIEYMTAAQALDLRRPLTPGRGSAAARDAVRDEVAHLNEDRVLSPDVDAVRGLMRAGAIRRAVASAGVTLFRRPEPRRPTRAD